MEKTQDRTITVGDYRFNEKAHLHELLKDGEYKPLTGVTTILGVIAKPMLIQWSANMACDFIKNGCSWSDEYNAWLVSEGNLSDARVAHRKKKESAGEWGTKVHTKIEQIINRAISESGGYIQLNEYVEYIELDTPESKSIQHFLDWAVPKGVKFLKAEQCLYSEEWWVGGIADIICEIDGKRYIGDIKTSSGIYSEHFVQCSAYAKMAIENKLHDKFDGVIILNLKKDGTFDKREFYNIEEGIKVFESALNIYRFKEATK